MKATITERTLTRKYREGGDNEVWDTVVPGLCLRIGKRRRTYSVTTRIDGRQIRRKVGTTDTVESISDARDAARCILRNAAKGIDPEEAERAAKREAERNRARTFRVVADEFMTKPSRAGLRSRDELQRKLDRDIFLAIGDMQIDAIDRADVRNLMRDKAKTAPVAANRILTLVRSILNFAVDEGYIDRNVAERIDREPETSRDRVLTKAEIRAFWGVLDDESLHMDPATRTALKFLLVTGQRRGEVAGATWAEFDFERDEWHIPATRTKNGLPHIVPLSPLALDLLDDMAEWTGGAHRKTGTPHATTDAVFPGAAGESLTGYSVSQAMHRALPKMNLEGGRATPHDLRRTMVTIMNEQLEIDPHVVEATVNHISGAAKAGVAGIYNRAQYLPQRRAALDAWATWLTATIEGRKPADNVVTLHATA